MYTKHNLHIGTLNRSVMSMNSNILYIFEEQKTTESTIKHLGGHMKIPNVDQTE